MNLKLNGEVGRMSQQASLEETISMLRDRIQSLLTKQEATNSRARILIALAGVPGSGKSTVSNALLQALPEHGIEDVAVLPMDGYHHTKETLSGFKDPELAFKRRGAPFTFDADALLQQVVLLKETPVSREDETETFILSPSFDHAVGDPVPHAISISSRCRLAIIEGNYTLLDQGRWGDIASLINERWFVDVPAEIARERLARRHLQAGIETTIGAAYARAEENDLPNGELIRAKMIRPDIRIVN